MPDFFPCGRIVHKDKKIIVCKLYEQNIRYLHSIILFFWQLKPRENCRGTASLDQFCS